LITEALDALPAEIGGPARLRIRDSAGATRPVVCPLLDADSGACLIYEARPVACRAYGFYAERESLLGCFRIESLAREVSDVVWGNHVSLQAHLDSLGPAAALSDWLEHQSDRC
jgi:Fe-S-cluster containining protein